MDVCGAAPGAGMAPGLVPGSRLSLFTQFLCELLQLNEPSENGIKPPEKKPRPGLANRTGSAGSRPGQGGDGTG